MLTSPLPFTLLLVRWLLVLVLLRRPLVRRGEACWDILAGKMEEGGKREDSEGMPRTELHAGRAGRRCRWNGKSTMMLVGGTEKGKERQGQVRGEERAKMLACLQEKNDGSGKRL